MCLPPREDFLGIHHQLQLILDLLSVIQYLGKPAFLNPTSRYRDPVNSYVFKIKSHVWQRVAPATQATITVVAVEVTLLPVEVTAPADRPTTRPRRLPVVATVVSRVALLRQVGIIDRFEYSPWDPSEVERWRSLYHVSLVLMTLNG